MLLVAIHPRDSSQGKAISNQGEIALIGALIPLFLPNIRCDDEEEWPTSLANNRWFQKKFNEWIVFAKHQSLQEYLWMYSWKELGQDLLPCFFRSLI